jgi:cytoskeletal protein CcmA (bactofilin family)
MSHHQGTHMIRKYTVTVLGFSAAVGLGLCVLTSGARANDYSKVFGSIHVPDGERTGDVSTVNGGIHVGANATVDHVSAVNGGVHLEPHATARELSTTNGGIQVEEGGRINGDIHSVNGGLHIADGAEVTGELSNVNGGIHVAAAHIHGSINTTNGGIDLGPNAHIDGDVKMERDHGWHSDEDRPPRVVIEPGTVIKGTLRFERKVRLYVSDRATIGAVEGATPVKFSGDHPPGDD